MRVLAVGDWDRDGKQEVAVGMKSGWVCVFHADGQVMWTRHFESRPEAISTHNGDLVIGFADGAVRQLDAAGRTLRLGKSDSGITVASSVAEGVLVGTASGQLSLLDK